MPLAAAPLPRERFSPMALFGLSGVAGRMESLNLRFRYVLAFLVGAVITAAVLRHAVHVYGGISREDIRAGALMAIPVVALAIIFSRGRQR